MQKIGVIAEYNPFHNGHLYHLNQIKKLYPDSLIILVLNGYFLQRGEMSILTKADKTFIALNNNVDLVVELPAFYGTQSADIFANAAVKILNELQCEIIVCGSESNNIEAIRQIAQSQLQNPAYDLKVKELLKKGLNYPTALAQALSCDFNFLPNDLLAISYQKSIFQNNFSLQLVTIKRTSNYHDLTSNDSIISAANIRNKIAQSEPIKKYLPPMSAKKIIKVNQTKLFSLIKYQIITSPDLKQYLDMDEGIEHRLQKYIKEVTNLEDLIAKIKTKRYTYNKINRLLIHVLLNLTKEMSQDVTLDYIHVLGFNTRGQKYLNTIKKELKLPMERNSNSLIYQFELKASLIYDLINATHTYEWELKNKPIIQD